MAEYIEREAALEECDWYASEFCECEYAIMPLKGALENFPAADVRPVVRGKWLHKKITDDFHVVGQCSVCKEKRRIDNFCPNCGADMREEHDD